MKCSDCAFWIHLQGNEGACGLRGPIEDHEFYAVHEPCPGNVEHECQMHISCKKSSCRRATIGKNTVPSNPRKRIANDQK